MDAPYNLPQICRETGLSCESCTEAAAGNLARICHGLQGKGIAQLFVQLYPDNACAPMHGHFAAAYRQADANVSSEDVPRRGVTGSNGGFGAFAVA